MTEQNKFINTLDDICNELSPFRGFLSSQEFLQLQLIKNSLQEALSQEKEKNRLLRIGIIGSVKSGKSTFLNAMIFDGENILPRAATPMTASLTRLRYAEESMARFVFYTEKDWEVIVNHAKYGDEIISEKMKEIESQYRNLNTLNSTFDLDYEDYKRRIRLNLPQVLRACMELRDSARNLNVGEYLGKEKEVMINGRNDIRKELEKYIGSGGELTPVVKFVDLAINDEKLHDIEIIDTPGLNDPVSSRSQQTYDFMVQCDAVFILSRAGQFYTQEDRNLIENNLKSCGIERKVIIATQMDLSVQNEVGKIKFYDQAFISSVKSIYNSAKRYSLSDNPLCVSALMSSHANKIKNNLPFDPEDEQLEKNIRHFEKYPVSANDFNKFSGMGSVKQKLDELRKDKDKIIYEHQKKSIDAAKRECINSINRLIDDSNNRKNFLQDNDIASIKEKHSQIHQGMNSIRSKIADIFLSMENEVNNVIADLDQRILDNSSKYDEIEVTKHTRQETSSYDTGILFWKKTHYSTKEITTFKAELSDAIGQLRNYAAKSNEDVNNAFIELINKEKVENKLKQTIIKEFRDLEIDFDEKMILSPIYTLLYKINIPKFEFNNDQYNDALIGKFPGSICNEMISKFKTEFQLQLQQLCKDIHHELDTQKKEISQLLLRESNEFSQKLLDILDEQMLEVQNQMINREESLKNYEETIRILNNCYNTITRSKYDC